MKDFNNIKQWLLPKLDARRLSVEQFANLSGLSKATIYFYMSDRIRPDLESMGAMCKTLSNTLCMDAKGNEYMEEVSINDGMSQFSPRKRGRPVGSKGGTKEVTARGR